MDRESGVTLVELLITMMLLAVISSVVFAAVLSTHTVVRSVDNESQGLTDVRVVSERLARDIRDARSVDLASADASHLTLWIDYNSDYRQSADEIVTWQLAPGAQNHFNVVRSAPGSPDKVEARTLVTNLAFSYCTSGGNCVSVPSGQSAPIRLVTVFMTYQAVGVVQHNRNVTFKTRLRNVA
jgi:prepilin-type N-terminal cleavage/methylation domain-containing protein